eukprot:scaffold31352_cov149-Skeletonema_marinoi.AAC.2
MPTYCIVTSTERKTPDAGATTLPTFKKNRCDRKHMSCVSPPLQHDLFSDGAADLLFREQHPTTPQPKGRRPHTP